jgi:hypothetical protein
VSLKVSWCGKSSWVEFEAMMMPEWRRADRRSRLRAPRRRRVGKAVPLRRCVLFMDSPRCGGV